MLNIQQNIILAPFTTFGIGGLADFFVRVASKEEISEAVKWAKEKGLDYFLLGSGANILVGDKGFRGLVIKNEAKNFVILGSNATPESNKEGSWTSQDDMFLVADSGAVVADIIETTAKKGLSGFEHFVGIPSTIGGALWQNLHFLSPDRSRTVYISEILESSVILSFSEGSHYKNKEEVSMEKDPSSFPTSNLDLVRNDNNITIKTVAPDYFKFGYDYSTLHNSRDIVLSAKFRLTQKTQEEVLETAKSNLAWRAEKHPQDAVHKSAGSIFKKIEGHGAGRLIQEVGLKGHQIGGAKISEKHANFILNTGGATAKDVRELIQLVESKVKDKLGFEMIPEISLVGEF